MKPIVRWVGIVPLNIAVLVVALMPIGGLIFLVSTVASGVVLLGGVVGFEIAGLTALAIFFLKFAWKLYIVGALFTFFVMTTFTYLECCVGMQKLRDHLRHAGGKHLENLLSAVTWPYSVKMIDNWLHGWYTSWLEAVLRSFEYWLFSRRKGVEFTEVNFQDGSVDTTRVTPETSREVMSEAIQRILD